MPMDDLPRRVLDGAFRRLDRSALNARDDRFDRPAGGQLHNHKVDHHDPEQSRDDQQQAADDIGEHGVGR